MNEARIATPVASAVEDPPPQNNKTRIATPVASAEEKPPQNNETRIAVTEDDKLDDFEIELNKKNAVKGDVYLAKITRIEPSLQAAFVDFGTNRNGFLPLTEIHPDYFKIPAADEKKIKELSDNIFNTNNEDEIIDNEKNVNDDAIDDEAAIEVNED